MDLLNNLVMGFNEALLLSNLWYCFVGVFIGTAVGVIPGLGPLATMSLLMPLTFALQPSEALIMLAGIYYGAQYGASTTAILLNLPGETSSAVTTLDGYQMARRGRAGPALAAAALSSFYAGTISTFVIAVTAVPLTALALKFGSAEYFSLMTLGLILAVALSSLSVLKSITMIFLGLLLSLSGTDMFTGYARLTFGQMELADGIDLVALTVGFFGIGEILRNLETQGGQKHSAIRATNLWPSMSDLKRIVGPSTRGAAIGCVLGVLPGGGALVSSFMAYNIEKKVSKNSAEFGHGAIEGVAAPESANNAGAQASFIPMLALGLPSNIIMAMMIGAMIMQGISPGPNVISSHPQLFWGLIASMWIGNAMLVVLNLPLIGLWTSLLRIPYHILFPGIIAFSCFGVYSIENSVFSIYVLMVSGVVGYVLLKCGFEPAPFVLAYVLGPMLEENFRRSMLISEGSLSIFVTQPISLGLLLASVVALVVVLRPSVARKRKELFVEDD